jgi:hypothetical protein
MQHQPEQPALDSVCFEMFEARGHGDRFVCNSFFHFGTGEEDETRLHIDTLVRSQLRSTQLLQQQIHRCIFLQHYSAFTIGNAFPPIVRLALNACAARMVVPFVTVLCKPEKELRIIFALSLVAVLVKVETAFGSVQLRECVATVAHCPQNVLHARKVDVLLE